MNEKLQFTALLGRNIFLFSGDKVAIFGKLTTHKNNPMKHFQVTSRTDHYVFSWEEIKSFNPATNSVEIH
jgi:hypothetical protein